MEVTNCRGSRQATAGYVVFIEPLEPAFVGGSSVGPFDTRFTNFPKDYYNGEGEAGFLEDDPTQMVAIDVGAGETLTAIDLMLNEPVNQLDLLEDDGEMLFTFQEGFSFPFWGKSDLPPRTSPPSKLDLGPLEVHSPEQNRVLVTWGVWPPAPEADRPRRCEAVSGCTPFATSRLAPLLPTTCRRSLH